MRAGRSKRRPNARFRSTYRAKAGAKRDKNTGVNAEVPFIAAPPFRCALPEKKLNAAYALEDYAAAKQALNVLHREPMDLNPSAARSLGEGMEETLTMHRLHIPMQLRKTLASTNVIESAAFSIVETVCRNVKRWHGGDQRERWVGSGLLVAQKQFRRIIGYKQIPALIKELAVQAPSKKAVVKARKAS